MKRSRSLEFSETTKTAALALLAFAFLFAISVSMTGCQPNQVRLNSQLSSGDSFPELQGTDIDGKPIALTDYKGKIVLLDFFGDW